MMNNTADREAEMRSFAHELRTPLTSIMGFAELLLEDESIAGEARESLRIIENESKKLAETLDNHLREFDNTALGTAGNSGV